MSQSGIIVSLMNQTKSMEYKAETKRAIQSFILNTPAFLYVAGSSGCGKTRLLRKIKSDAQQNSADCRILMMDAYILVERLIDAFQSKTYPALVEELASYDIIESARTLSDIVG